MLLDETLPDAGGPFLRRLHGSPAWRDLPVILLTASSTAAPDCLGKPLQPRMVLEQVARTLERRPAPWAEFQLHRGTDDSPSRVYL
jgi:DNA-binding response OmpR family regulator